VLLDSRDQRPKVLDAVPEAFDGDDSDPDSLDVLLELEAGVVRDEYFEAGIDGRSEQDAVTKTKPSLGTYRRGLMAEQLRR
jgi:hypothetical protein